MTGTLPHDTLAVFGRYVAYIAGCAASLLLVRTITPLPQNVFRKLLHVAAFTSSVFVVAIGANWLADALALALFALLVWPVLTLLERWDGYEALFVQKRPGEVKQSLLLLFFSQAALVAWCLGTLHAPYVLVASTCAWGLGDIAAAWVGRPLGKHKLGFRLADPHKSWEGTCAMAAVSFVSCLAALLWYGAYAPPVAALASAVVGVVSALVEACSKEGTDTVTVPVANVIVLWILSLVLPV